MSHLILPAEFMDDSFFGMPTEQEPEESRRADPPGPGGGLRARLKLIVTDNPPVRSETNTPAPAL